MYNKLTELVGYEQSRNTYKSDKKVLMGFDYLPLYYTELNSDELLPAYKATQEGLKYEKLIKSN